MMDIDPEHEDDFNRWYDDEHVPERMAIPGFLTGRRYRAIEGGPKYLAIYEMESPEVLDSPAYKYASGQGRSEWTAQVKWSLGSTRRDGIANLRCHYCRACWCTASL